MQVKSVHEDGSIKIAIANHQFYLKPHSKTSKIERQFTEKIYPQQISKESEDWKRAYQYIKLATFSIATGIDNLGIYDEKNDVIIFKGYRYKRSGFYTRKDGKKIWAFYCKELKKKKDIPRF